VQVGVEEGTVRFVEEVFLFSECNVIGTMVSFCCGIGKAPPLSNTFIVPEMLIYLYALFEYGLTIEPSIEDILSV